MNTRTGCRRPSLRSGRSGGAAATASVAHSVDERTAPAPWEIASVAFNDAVIDYVVDDDATQISIDALHLSGIAPTKRQFPLHAKLTIKDPNARSR